MQLTRTYDPFAGFDIPAGVRLFEDAMNRLLSEPAARPWAPPVDILETEDELVVKADLPEVEMKDVHIEIEQGTLTLKGERKFEKPDGKGGYHRLERSFGKFMRAFSIPDTVDTEKVKAEYKLGTLTITLPKKEAAKPRTVKVEVSID
jgi:HSP20 family protein